MLQALYLLDHKGKPLISRCYRGPFPQHIIEKFMALLKTTEEKLQCAPPIISSGPPDEGIYYLYVRMGNIFGICVVGVTTCNANAASIFVFLHKFLEVLKGYFKVIEEETIRDNFVLIYELLDEMVDWGYPQFTETPILKEYITQRGFRFITRQEHPPESITSNISWRSEGIKYRKNEVFLDLVENLNLSVNSNGHVISSDITGILRMKCDLSGMPELRLGRKIDDIWLGLNDKISLTPMNGSGLVCPTGIELEDIKFHQCVRLNMFDQDRTISFIPPDGEFELMRYRLSVIPGSSHEAIGTQPILSSTGNNMPLIWVECTTICHSETRTECFLKAKANFLKKYVATGVEVHIPVPYDIFAPKFKQFPGGKEYWFNVEYSMPTIKEPPSLPGAQISSTTLIAQKAPISVIFEIPYYAVSGLSDSGYQAVPWVRYLTRNGSKGEFPFLRCSLQNADPHQDKCC
ncbi:hypothetical protein DI09_60p140 [Mitosporidium daphniae]|uniref:MHD domain-containing protein n=1 Tax=Mitosporidium daphniae TaxID=1485682 RepID=A0A098VNJ3_9MICR|nr:uncharacterized protein DI09_60p140 [Mitosporidium daphniae]KGG50647.1 hypothetical protein DI09_60p140 [Mitosporidium daphniae]|eukprot:XP_013237074.1 uncharacterized protein DI09_60p140 [Mitosporidium daphniae]